VNADAIILADGIVTVLQESIGSGSDVIVSREWESITKINEITTPMVQVFPTGYLDSGAVDRTEQFIDAMASLAYMRRYDGTAGRVPKEWIDEQVNWFEEKIFNVLDANGLRINGFWPFVVEVTEVCYIEYIRSKVFWSEMDLTFRKIV
jgi:hypothetical protein